MTGAWSLGYIKYIRACGTASPFIAVPNVTTTYQDFSTATDS